MRASICDLKSLAHIKYYRAVGHMKAASALHSYETHNILKAWSLSNSYPFALISEFLDRNNTPWSSRLGHRMKMYLASSVVCTRPVLSMMEEYESMSWSRRHLSSSLSTVERIALIISQSITDLDGIRKQTHTLLSRWCIQNQRWRHFPDCSMA
ncbi:hypothetical protein BDV95DRAFT_309765 [Massariosphaeria phaeospora]|uniref:Uncharacterized protein n=1 Tax=Massariosphaeria phaeospora TaxID=100035 RepID=A0A7C8IIK5_9PLEO|nr:hypothetical protein BDV95DRAFT_309765 [Massariosphaeria phaeospora]